MSTMRTEIKHLIGKTVPGVEAALEKAQSTEAQRLAAAQRKRREQEMAEYVVWNLSESNWFDGRSHGLTHRDSLVIDAARQFKATFALIETVLAGMKKDRLVKNDGEGYVRLTRRGELRAAALRKAGKKHIQSGDDSETGIVMHEPFADTPEGWMAKYTDETGAIRWGYV